MSHGAPLRSSPLHCDGGMKWFQLNRLPRRAERGSARRRERGGTTARGDNTLERERGGRKSAGCSTVSGWSVSLHAACVPGALALHSWHAAHLSCSSQYRGSVITCLVVLPSPWPRLPPVVTLLFCSTLIRRCMSR